MSDPLHSATADNLGRLFCILMRIAGRPPHGKIDSGSLASACGCCPKTIGRAIARLRDVGAPVEWDARAGSYMLPEKGWSLPILQLTLPDVLALALARSLLTAPSVPYANAIRSALERLTVGIPPSLLPLLEAQASVVYTAGKPRNYSNAPIAPLLSAAASRLSIRMDYESMRSGRSWRQVDPYGVEDRSGYLELHAWCYRNQAVLTFALDRIHEVRILDDAFVIREELWNEFRQQSATGGLRGGPAIAVEVRFDGEVAKYALARQWPSGLTIQPQFDDSALLTGEVNGSEGILRELLRWRRHAVVVGGPELRARMEEELRAMVGRYEDSS